MKDIKGYEGLYAVTSCGKVWSYRSKIFLKATANNKGYLMVGLHKDGHEKKYLLQRLVLEAYCPVEEMEKLEVNHKDEDRKNDSLNNLEWTTHKENCNYSSHNEKQSKAHTNHPRKSKRVRCVETEIIYPSMKEASRQTGIHNDSISRCCRGVYQKAGGFHWEFVD